MTINDEKIDIIEQKNMSAEDLYKWCMQEYDSSNYITKKLINNIYSTLSKKILNPILPNIDTILEVGCGACESTRRLLNCFKGKLFEASEFDIRYINALKKLTITQPSRLFICIINFREVRFRDCHFFGTACRKTLWPLELLAKGIF